MSKTLTKAQLEKLQREHERLHKAIADVTVIWASVESALGLLLGAIMASKHQDGNRIACAVIFAPTSLEARIDMVDAAFQVISRRIPMTSQVRPLWNKLIKNINGQRGIRNAVAHGTISTIDHRGGRHARITPPAFDPRRKMYGEMEGYSANDLEYSVAEIKKLLDRIYAFDRFIRAWTDERPEDCGKEVAELIALTPA